VTALEIFAEESARRFLQSVVFVDDEIYVSGSGKPVEVSIPLGPPPSPFTSVGTRDQARSGAAAELAEPVWEATSGAYHPRELVESFAEIGMACALYEPEEGFQTDKNSKLFKLCDRADIVILDWDLYGQDGGNILPLVCSLASSGQSSVPHHVRLCVLYTTKPDLTRVASQVFDALKKLGDMPVSVADIFTITAGATRISVFGKPDVSGRTEASKVREVPERDLANCVVREFARMNAGLLPSYALNAMASIRRNTKRIIEKFDSTMDASFMVNRALLIADGETFDQLPELLAEELLSVIQDTAIPQVTIDGLVTDYSASAPLLTEKLEGWQIKPDRPAKNSEQLARLFIKEGKPAVKDDMSFNKLKERMTELHNALECDKSHANKKLAALFNIRTNYGSSAPALQLGSIVRYRITDEWAYAVCIQPLCDGVRLIPAGVISFPFWKLVDISSGDPGRGMVFEIPSGGYGEFVANGKVKDRLSFKSFEAGASGVVSAEKSDIGYVLGETGYEWVAQLKPAHAQRIAFDVAQKLSRVGLIESEWLRQRSGEAD